MKAYSMYGRFQNKNGKKFVLPFFTKLKKRCKRTYLPKSGSYFLKISAYRLYLDGRILSQSMPYK